MMTIQVFPMYKRDGHMLTNEGCVEKIVGVLRGWRKDAED